MFLKFKEQYCFTRWASLLIRITGFGSLDE